MQREVLTAQSLRAAGGDPEAMQLDEDFLRALEQEVGKLHNNDIRFKAVGDLSPFDSRIVELVRAKGSAVPDLPPFLPVGAVSSPRTVLCSPGFALARALESSRGSR